MKGPDAITDLPLRHAFTNSENIPARFMSRCEWELEPGEASRSIDQIAVADAAGLDLDEYLSGAGVFGFKRLDEEVVFKAYGCEANAGCHREVHVDGIGRCAVLKSAREHVLLER